MTTIEIETTDGTAEAYLTGSGPGVLLYMDILGLRPQIEQMSDRVAGWGYTVLAPNVLYRSGTAAETSPTVDLREPGARDAFFELAGPRGAELTAERSEVDIPFYLGALREHCAAGPVGTVGYCLGARLAVRTASLDPEVAACAGFHGGRLVTDEETSPHRGLPNARAEFVFGHGDNDGSMPPEAVQALGAALEEAGLTASNEIFPGSPHGYTMSDTSMYDEAGAERAFDELEALLERTLG